MSGNFTTLLWSKLFKELSNKLHIPQRAAYPYLQAICHNLITDHTAALTGPLSRGDNVTIEKNLKALSQDPFAIIYRAFVEVFDQLKEQ